MEYPKITPEVLKTVQWAVDNGASGAFVAMLMVDDGLAWSKARRAAKADASGEEFVARHGHFLTALWRGDEAKAFARADIGNRKAMDRAGLTPEEATSEAFVP